MRLRLHEALSYGERAIPNAEARQVSNESFVHVVEQGQRSGSIDPTLDPRDTAMFIVAVASWHASVPQLARMIEGETSDEDLHERRRAAVVEAVRRLLEPR